MKYKALNMCDFCKFNIDTCGAYLDRADYFVLSELIYIRCLDKEIGNPVVACKKFEEK